MIIEKEYGVPLTDAELLELSDEVAGFCRAIADKREEMKQQSAFLRQEIKELQAKLDDRLDRLQSKREVRFVRLNLEYNRPEPGKVEIYDIGTTIGCHTGTGTVALFFTSNDEREDER